MEQLDPPLALSRALIRLKLWLRQARPGQSVCIQLGDAGSNRTFLPICVPSGSPCPDPGRVSCPSPAALSLPVPPGRPATRAHATHPEPPFKEASMLDV